MYTASKTLLLVGAALTFLLMGFPQQADAGSTNRIHPGGSSFHISINLTPTRSCTIPTYRYAKRVVHTHDRYGHWGPTTVVVKKNKYYHKNKWRKRHGHDKHRPHRVHHRHSPYR